MRRLHNSGFSLIELMISIAIGLLITAGVTVLIARTSASRGELEKQNRQIENGRYAYQVIAQDLRHAGYYGLIPATKTAPAAPDVCSTDIATIANSLSFPVQGISNYGSGNPELVRAAIFSCLPATAILSGTDVLAIRRAATEASTLSVAGVATPALVSDTAYVQTGLVPDGGVVGRMRTTIIAAVPGSQLLTTFPAKLKDPATGTSPTNPPVHSVPAPLRRYVLRIYFVSPCSEAVLTCPTGSTPVPTLKRLELGAGPAFPSAPEVIVEGIEDLQVDYGVDATGSDPGGGAPLYLDGSASTYVQCNPLSATTYEANCLWQDVVAAKIYLLARNIDKSQGYTDTRQYRMGLRDASAPKAAKGDDYKRHVYSGLVRLNNVGMNRECTPLSVDPC